MTLHLIALINALYAYLNQTQTQRAEVVTFQIYKRVTLYVYAYRDLIGSGNEIDLMLDFFGRSYHPIRYQNGKIAYDIAVSKKTWDTTQRAYDYLIKNGLRAHSDYLGVSD